VKIGRVLKLWRESQGLGLRTFAKELGISHGTLRRIEQGENFDAITLMKILRWLFLYD